MKYIRTKDGIYKVVKEQKNHFIISMENIEEDCYDVPCIKRNDIIKQADTIEELCDEFVIIDDLDNGINTLWHTKVFSSQEVRKMSKNEIYGSIWTDKGLIYVAKMNDKGELELL